MLLSLQQKLKQFPTIPYIILLVALFCRLAFVFTLDDELVWYDAKNYHSIAISLSEGHGFLSTYNPYHSSAFAPLFPYFLGVLYWMFEPSLLLVRIVQSILGTVICLLVYLIARRFFNERVGLIAILIVALHPLFIYSSGVLYPIIIFTLLILLTVFLLSGFENNGRQSTLAMLVLIGFCAGLALLTRPVFIFLIPFLPVWFLVGEKFSIFETWKFSSVIVLVAGLTVAPWTVKNYLQYDRLFFITSEGGHSFYTSNMPDFNIDRTKEEKTPEDVERQLIGIADHEKDKVYTRAALKYIVNSPGEFLKIYMQKFINFWRFYPKTMSQNKDTSQRNIIVSIIFYGFLIPFAFIGMAVSIKKWKQYFLLYASILSFNLGYSLFITTVRYRLPIEPYIVVFASVGILALYEKIVPPVCHDLVSSNKIEADT